MQSDIPNDLRLTFLSEAKDALEMLEARRSPRVTMTGGSQGPLLSRFIPQKTVKRPSSFQILPAPNQDGQVGHMKYKEAQIHGPVDFRCHVERLVAHQRHRSAGDRLKVGERVWTSVIFQGGDGWR